jgi:hypothetical protein
LSYSKTFGERVVRSFILAITLFLAAGAIADQAQAQTGGGADVGRYRTKTTFYYNLCIARGGTHYRCGVRLHYWTNRHPNGKVVY